MSNYHDYNDELHLGYRRKRKLDEDVDFSFQEEYDRIDIHPNSEHNSFYELADETNAESVHFKDFSFIKPQPSPPLTAKPLMTLNLPRLFGDRTSSNSVQDSGKRFGSVTVLPPRLVKEKNVRGPTTSCTLRVGTLPRNITKKHLSDLFSPYGLIKEIRHKPSSHFAHIQYDPKDQCSLIRAMDLDRCFITIDGSLQKTNRGRGDGNCGSIQVQFVDESASIDDVRKPKSGLLIPYTVANAFIVSRMLKNDEVYMKAVMSLKSWFDRGHCTRTSASTFFSQLNAIHSCALKVDSSLNVERKQLLLTLSNHRKKLESSKKECKFFLLFIMFVVFYTFQVKR